MWGERELGGAGEVAVGSSKTFSPSEEGERTPEGTKERRALAKGVTLVGKADR